MLSRWVLSPLEPLHQPSCLYSLSTKFSLSPHKAAIIISLYNCFYVCISNTNMYLSSFCDNILGSEPWFLFFCLFIVEPSWLLLDGHEIKICTLFGLTLYAQSNLKILAKCFLFSLSFRIFRQLEKPSFVLSLWRILLCFVLLLL
jgi:F0F1-type ATP synthase assembly protein I